MSTDTTATPTESTPDAPAEVESATAPPAETDAVDGDSPDTLGDAGKRAIDAMKADKKAAQQEAREAKSALEALQAKLDGKEAEHAAAQEAQKVRDEALAGANQRILKAEVRATAAGKLADPADALRYIELSDFEVGSDGEVDSAAIAQAIDDLITSKPYLAAQGGSRFKGTADGGARTDASKPSQLTQADIARMSPEEVADAHDAGRFDQALGRK